MVLEPKPGGICPAQVWEDTARPGVPEIVLQCGVDCLFSTGSDRNRMEFLGDSPVDWRSLKLVVVMQIFYCYLI